MRFFSLNICSFAFSSSTSIFWYMCPATSCLSVFSLFDSVPFAFCTHWSKCFHLRTCPSGMPSAFAISHSFRLGFSRHMRYASSRSGRLGLASPATPFHGIVRAPRKDAKILAALPTVIPQAFSAIRLAYHPRLSHVASLLLGIENPPVASHERIFILPINSILLIIFAPLCHLSKKTQFFRQHHMNLILVPVPRPP